MFLNFVCTIFVTHRQSKMARRLFHHKNIFTILLIMVTKSTAYSDDINEPCKYLDSINITDGIQNYDDSILFEGISYPKELYATYDYAFRNGAYREGVAPHIRGCICAVDPSKPCVRMCCPRGQHLKRASKGSYCAEDEGVFNMSVRVFDNDSFSEGNIFDLFNFVVGKPCLNISNMDPVKRKQSDTWVLFKDGNISKGDPPLQKLDKNQYCFNSIPRNGTFETALMVCFKPLDRTRDYWVLCGMFLSVPFLLATVLVYTILPELRNVHGKSLVCYLCGLVVGYTVLGLVKLNGSDYIDPVYCQTMGYTAYFAFMSAFFWLNVISFDLWRNFCGIYRSRRFPASKQFIYYSIYAWGSSIILVAICLAIDYNPNVPTDFQPGIGVRECFVGSSRWSQFLYLYLPIMLIMISNLTFFVLTFLKIREVQKEMAKITNTEESRVHRKNFDKEKANYGLFLRLLIVMGMTWAMEPISWIIAPEAKYFYPTDAMNAIQGVVIFFLFVFRVKVKQLMVTRWQICRAKLRSKKNRTTVERASSKSCTGTTTIDEDDHSEMEMAPNN